MQVLLDAGLFKYTTSDIQLDNKKNYQKLMYDLMSPPDIKELKDTAKCIIDQEYNNISSK